MADFTSNGNYTQYSLDSHNLYKVVFNNGKASPEKKIPFVQDAQDVIRITVDLSPDGFAIKNKAGVIADSIKKSDIGRFGFLDDVTLNVSR